MPKRNKKFDKESKDGYNPEEEIVFDKEEGLNPTLKKLREKLKKAVTEKQEYLEGWQRSKADFVNYKKDEEKRRGEIVKLIREDVITEILPILDSFNMAKESPVWGDGIEQIFKQFVSVLKKNGLEEIAPLNEDFDPNLHEAVETVKGKKDGKIIEVLQKGYLLNNKIIRPARVKVSK
jgi:molecular chaperone GrpE